MIIDDKEINAVTYELLKRIEELKKNIKNEMMHGEYGILKGVAIFEVIIKELNYDKINDEVVDEIINYVNSYVKNKEEAMQHVDPRVHYGINRCFLVLCNYNEVVNNKVKNKKKKLKLL